MESQKGALKVALFRGELHDAMPSNSLVVPRNQRKWADDEELKNGSVFIDGDDLVFRSTDSSIEILRLNLVQLLSDDYRRLKERAVGLSLDNRLALALHMREKAKELNVRMMSKDDWDDIFNVMARSHRSVSCELDLVETNIDGNNHIFGDLHFVSGVEVSPTLPDATFYGRSYYANGRKRGVVFYGLSPLGGFKFESERDAIAAISNINENSAPGF
ncbi:hypothetical protein [Kluyvera intermedia]|uniref:hypothetical protein n=1 Tax=Kluyvera intermedia TaxID=61648 RepID=UPI003524C7F5